MRFFSFSLLIGGGAVLGHLYLYVRLVRPLAPNRKVRAFFAGLLAAVALTLVFRGALRSLHPVVRAAHGVFAAVWMGVALSFVSALAVGDLVRLAVSLVDKLRYRWTPAPLDLDRRRFARALPLSVLACGGGTAAFGTYRAFAPAEVTELALRLPRLPRALDGLTIVQLSDIHVGTFIGQRFIDRLVAQVNAEKPDLVAITGDLVDGDVRTLGPVVGAFSKLRARYGSFFVPGNHEYHSGADAWMSFLDGLGVRVLRNRHVSIGDDGGRIDLAGVDDFSASYRGARRGHDLEGALAGRDPDRAAVLLAHQPRLFREAAARGVGLQLSGHTHGGQLVPMTMLVGLAFEHHRGLYQHDDAHIYVSRGCGFWGPPARVGSAPEIVKLSLVA